MSSPSHDTASWKLRNLPLPARLTLALFLIAAGFGYFAGLVQLHFAHAKGGHLLPTPTDTVEVYNGPVEQAAPKSRLERLLTTKEGPFNGGGTMRPAFFEKSGGWKTEIKERSDTKVRPERETEIEVFVHWIRSGADRKAFEAKRGEEETGEYPIPDALAKAPLTDEFKAEKDGKPVLLLRKLIEKRCMECHSEGAGHPDRGRAPGFPLETYDQIAKYTKVQPKASALSLEKLAMTTHAHWLSFAVLFMLTGFIFCFTSYPHLARCIFGPLTLLVQMIDICCWWLARYDPFFAYMIIGTGCIVALSLLIQILGSLFDMFRTKGQVVLILLILVTLFGGVYLWSEKIEPYLLQKEALQRQQ